MASSLLNPILANLPGIHLKIASYQSLQIQQVLKMS